MTTLNQIIKNLELVAQGHEQIQTYKHGKIGDFLDERLNVEYPAFFSECNTFRIGNKEVGYNFSFYFLDKIKEDLDNETEVQSDIVLVAADVVAQIRNNPDYGFRIAVEGGFSGELFTEALTDNLAGSKLDVTILVDFGFDRCSIPGTIETV